MADGIGGLLGGSASAMSEEEAQRLINEIYGSALRRPAEEAGMNYWSPLLTSGQITPDQFRANVMASNEAKAMSGVTPMSFGQQIIGQQPMQMTQYQARTPTFQNFAPADAYGSQFERALAYQSALPSLLQPFNPAEMPTIYPQVAVNPYRLDIRNIELPQWLKDAIAKGTPATDTVEKADTTRGEE